MSMKWLRALVGRWIGQEDGTSAVEAALIFPILTFLMLATYDMGNAIIANQKVLRASQVTGDLVTRERTIDTAGLDEAIFAGELALIPQPTSSYGVDIVSIRFDDLANPIIVWRETRNMTANPDVLTSVASLAEANGGVVVTTIQYNFHPLFGDFIFGDIPFQEMAFTRGRKSAVVNRV